MDPRQQNGDLIFLAGEKKIAFEIETGSLLDKPDQLTEKIERLKQYGPTLGRIEAKQKIDELFAQPESKEEGKEKPELPYF